MKIVYASQDKPEGIAQAMVIANPFLSGHPSVLILGDNIFYGHSLIRILRETSSWSPGATVFGYQVARPQDYAIIESNPEGEILSLQEKPERPKSRNAVPGLYFYDERAPEFAAKLKPSPRGEYEITDLNLMYLERGELRVRFLGRGTAWLDAGTNDGLLDAANFISVIEQRQGLKIACVEEIALHNGWIANDQFRALIDAVGKSQYREYLERVLPST